MTRRPRASWHLILLAVIGVAIAVAAVIELGAPSSSARTSREVVTAEPGVVQSTVSGTGNIEPGTDVGANFKTSGTLNSINVHVGEHVHKGQLLGTLDPTSAQLSVNQAQLSLTAAEDSLTALEDGSTSASTGSGSTGASATNARTTLDTGTTEFVSETNRQSTTTSAPTTTSPPTTTGTTTTPTRPTGATTPTRPSGTTTTPSRPIGTSTQASTTPTSTTPAQGGTTGRPSSSTSSSSGSPASSGSSGGTSTSTTPSASSIASAQASVDSAQASLENAQQTLADTKLRAPAAGTIASLASVSVGDPISAGGASSSSSSSGSGASGSGSSESGASGTSAAGSLGGSSSSSGSSGSSGSSTAFAEIVNTNSLTMTVAFSESDITKVKDGQTATVSLDAISGLQLAAHVSSISILGTTSSSVVSYDATITLDQTDSRVRPGMSASASVITSQAQGITLPNAAVSGTGSLTTVNVLKNGKTVGTPVVVGLRGDNRTQIVSGLPAGSQVVVTETLPALGSSTAGSSSSSGTLGGGTRGFGGLGSGGLSGAGSRFFGGGSGFAGGGPPAGVGGAP